MGVATDTINHTQNYANLSVDELLSALKAAEKRNTELEKENARLTQIIAIKNNKMAELKEELQEDNLRIDFLFEAVTFQERQKSLLEASFKGELPIARHNATTVANEQNFAIPTQMA